MALRSINPFNGKLIGEYEELAPGKVTRLVDSAHEVFLSWRDTTLDRRAGLLKNLAGILKVKKDYLAAMITQEMGKPIRESFAEIEKCAWVCEYYSENAREFLMPETIATDADRSYVIFEPLGALLGIMPWNFPFWQVFRFAVPSVTAGNTVVLKHASSVQGSAGEIEQLFREAGYPEGVFRNLCIKSDAVASVIDHSAIKAVSLTGSGAAGSEVAARAGKNIKKSLLELGGSNAFVVFGDADIGKAISEGITGRMINAGQSCIASKRFFVHRSVMESFVPRLRGEMEKLKVGDPMERTTDIGPLSSLQQAEEVERQVRKSVEMGAVLLLGGNRDDCFFEPTLALNVSPGMPLLEEEVFGPVIPVMPFDSDEQAIELVNGPGFGLGTTLCSRDTGRMEEIARQLGDGAVFINSLVKSDPRLPFGGTKRSGYGRELSRQGILEFVNVKTVYVRRW